MIPVMLEWFSDGRRLIAIAIALATLIVAWMFRYETFGPNAHRNRFTGAICLLSEECWIKTW
jgi:hypothetical protein